jgi:hypothetical protein
MSEQQATANKNCEWIDSTTTTTTTIAIATETATATTTILNKLWGGSDNNKVGVKATNRVRTSSSSPLALMMASTSNVRSGSNDNGNGSDDALVVSSEEDTSEERYQKISLRRFTDEGYDASIKHFREDTILKEISYYII